MNNRKTDTKGAVVTINIGRQFTRLAELTLPFMQAYAQKTGAELVVIDNVKPTSATRYSAYWAKFHLYELLRDYDRILYLDLDTLVYPHCPDIFALVPPDKLGVLMETDYANDQTEEIREFQTREKDIGWRRDYFNVGVMVVSRAHREIFNRELGSEEGRKFPEQTRINYNAQKLNIPIFKLDYRYNHMYFCGDLNRRDRSYIFHYAGIDHEVRLLLIAEDIERYRDQAPPVQLEEFGLFFETHFPGQDMASTMMVYRLFKDPGIED